MQKGEINLIVETRSGEPMESLAVALAFAKDLRTTQVEDWAAEVQAIVDDCRRLREAEKTPSRVDPNVEKRREIEAQIQRLQQELKAISAT